MDRKKVGEPIFSGPKEPDRGYTAMAWRLEDTEVSKGDALIEIFKDDKIVREFLLPAYKVWNIPAHFRDIVDGEIAKHDGGIRMAGWNGITDPGAPQPLP